MRRNSGKAGNESTPVGVAAPQVDMEQTILDFEGGKTAKEAGIERASRGAGSDWIDQGVNSLVGYLRKNGPAPIEQWRDWYLRNGGQAPVSHKAWGALTNAAVKRGLIKPTGQYRPARSIKTHGHFVRKWEVT